MTSTSYYLFKWNRRYIGHQLTKQDDSIKRSKELIQKHNFVFFLKYLREQDSSNCKQGVKFAQNS